MTIRTKPSNKKYDDGSRQVVKLGVLKPLPKGEIMILKNFKNKLEKLDPNTKVFNFSAFITDFVKYGYIETTIKVIYVKKVKDEKYFIKAKKTDKDAIKAVILS